MKEHYGQVRIWLFFFGLAVSFDRFRCLQLLEMKVPELADPRENLTLGCRYDMGKEELYSVKWYKDDQEFFRYTPNHHPYFLAFNVPGVYLVSPPVEGDFHTGSDCDTDHCTVHLTGLTTAHSGGAYRCEVSTDAPTFRVVFDTTNVTVAALGKENPKVEGIDGSYPIGGFVSARCTSSPADPPPTMTWYINGKQAPPLAVGQPRTTYANATNFPGLSLVSRTLALRFHAERHHFLDPGDTMELACVASTPLIRAPSKNTTVIAIRKSSETHSIHTNNLLSNQKLEWPNGSGINKCFVHWMFLILIAQVLM